jgi:hypothetical protein
LFGTWFSTLAGLAAGKYAVEAQRDGFKKATALVQLGPRSRAGLILTLEIAGVRTEISAVVSDNLMDKLPAFDQDYVSMMSVFLDAGSTGTAGPRW